MNFDISIQALQRLILEHMIQNELTLKGDACHGLVWHVYLFRESEHVASCGFCFTSQFPQEPGCQQDLSGPSPVTFLVILG